LETEAVAIEAAVDNAISAGTRTTDLGGKVSTEEMTQAVLDRIFL
jgi:isocitrate/isopropylmalate dehydrogenase